MENDFTRDLCTLLEEFLAETSKTDAKQDFDLFIRWIRYKKYKEYLNPPTNTSV